MQPKILSIVLWNFFRAHGIDPSRSGFQESCFSSIYLVMIKDLLPLHPNVVSPLMFTLYSYLPLADGNMLINDLFHPATLEQDGTELEEFFAFSKQSNTLPEAFLRAKKTVPAEPLAVPYIFLSLLIDKDQLQLRVTEAAACVVAVRPVANTLTIRSVLRSRIWRESAVDVKQVFMIFPWLGYGASGFLAGLDQVPCKSKLSPSGWCIETK